MTKTSSEQPKGHPHAKLNAEGQWENMCGDCAFDHAVCPPHTDCANLCSGFALFTPKPDPVPECGRDVQLPEDPALRAEYPIFDGFMAYFPNAVAEVARLSYKATQQHHPDEDMHWDRSKSLDHLNKIGRHMIDAGKFDDNGIRHSVMIAWRAMANLQEELEKQEGYPPSPASRKRPW